MPKFANNLDRLLADVVLASKFNRTEKLNLVRAYIAKVSRDRLNREIAQITSEPELRQLAGAGVPGYAQSAFLSQVKLLTTPRGRT